MHEKEPLLLPKTDVEIILKVVKKVRVFHRDLITDRELIAAFFNDMAFAHTDHAVEQVAARLPKNVYPILREFITRIQSEENPGNRFVLAPHQVTDAELGDLNDRVRHIAAVLADFVQSPVAAKEIVDLPFDAKSEFLFHLDTVPGTSCRKDSCDLPRIELGVFCPEHHYEMLKTVDRSTE